MDNIIFYFTGTGNSLKIAKDIIDKTGMPDWNNVSIAKSISDVQSYSPKGIVGFVFPVYYCGIPQIVCDFIKKIDLSNTLYTFVVATYGATGGNGGCLHQAKNIFLQKNIRLNAGFYIKTVDNFILWTWDVPSKAKQQKVHKLTDIKVQKITKCITKKDEYFDESFTEYIGPKIFGYKNFISNVNVSDKLFFIGSECNSCGICAKVCPTYNIKLSNDKPEWKSEYCQRCLACLHLCPQKTINYGKNTKKRSRYKNPLIKIEELFN
jgi:ferredoxin/flavodoxin